MSELRSAIEWFRADRLADQPDARVQEDLLELQRAVEALEVERLRRVAELDRRATYAVDGHLSTASWLVASCRVGWGAARSDVRLARTLREMPQTRRALDEGEVSLAAARVLADARREDPEAFTAIEGTLIEAATRHRIADLQRVVSWWRLRVERERSLDGDDPLRARRRLHASVTLGGMVRLDGDLDPETGESVLTALRAVLDAETRSPDDDDRRTPAQRRADALGEVCRGWLDAAPRPSVAGERPHVTVTLGLDALVGETPGALDHVGPVDADVARALACDASVTRVVLGPRSEPLDVGRRTPVVPPAIRRAVIVRDRRCRFPGCDRPHTWCDAHHVVHWARGGPTSLANLILLCRRHHRAVHQRFGLELVEGRPVFRRPDGSILLEDRAPP